MNKSPGLEALASETEENVPQEQSASVREFMARLAEAQAAEASAPSLEEQRRAVALRQQENAQERAAAEQDTLKDLTEFSAEESRQLLRFSHLTDVKTIEELVSLVQEYVLYCFKQEKRGVRLYEINRKFGAKARKLASSSVDLTSLVARSGEITVAMYLGITLLYPTRDYYTYSWSLKGVPEREDFRQAMFERSMDAMPRSVRTGTGRRRRKAV